MCDRSKLLNAYGRNAVVPGMAALIGPAAQICYVTTGLGLATSEVAVVKDDNAGASKYTDGRDVVTQAAQGFAGFATAQTEEAAAKVAVPIEAGSAAAPVAAMRVTARG